MRAFALAEAVYAVSFADTPYFRLLRVCSPPLLPITSLMSFPPCHAMLLAAAFADAAMMLLFATLLFSPRFRFAYAAGYLFSLP